MAAGGAVAEAVMTACLTQQLHWRQVCVPATTMGCCAIAGSDGLWLWMWALCQPRWLGRQSAVGGLCRLSWRLFDLITSEGWIKAVLWPRCVLP
jgi:hypothetical protein